MILNDTSVLSMLQQLADRNGGVVELYQNKSGAYMYGARGMVMQQLRAMNQRTDTVRFLGIVVPAWYEPNEQEKQQLITTT